jgi:hypothetical protein
VRVRTDKLQKLEERRRRIASEIERIQAAEAEQQRKRDARCKIVVGAVVLGLVERGEWPRELLLKELDKQLTRNHDRALFDLPPREAAADATKRSGRNRSSREVVA